MRRFLRLLLPIVTVLQLAGSALLASRGFPYFGTGRVPNAAPWETAIVGFHLPGLGLLWAGGFCCGLRNGLVIGPRVVGGHIRMTPAGGRILASVNWLGWIVLLGLSQLRRPRRHPAVGSARMEPPPPDS